MKNPFSKTRTPLDTTLFEFDFIETKNNRGYLREIAIQTVVGHIARSVANSRFRYTKDGVRQYDDIDYLLNVRPNTSQSSTEFWYHFVYKLITENEVLAFFTDDRQLIIADCFDRTEFALVPDVFSNVTYKNFTYNRTFNENDVIYLQFSNKKILSFMDTMYKDYAELYNNMYTNQLRNNQVRGILKIDSNQSQDERSRNNIQELVNRIFKSFSEKAISIVPLFKGFEYQEVSNGGSSSSAGSTSQLMDVSNGLINELADILGVPRGLLHGELSSNGSLDDLIKAYIKFTIEPLNKMIEDELNSKIIGKSDYLNGERIKIIGLKAKDALENADSVDKLIASGAYTRNEIRLKLGDEAADNEELDVYLVTKNYTTADSTTEGGENN